MPNKIYLPGNPDCNPHYNYDLQVWVRDGIVLDCGHPADRVDCCNARRLAGEEADHATL